MHGQNRVLEKLELIKRIVLDNAKKFNVNVEKIILFGSRARGDYREDSDWDLLIIIKEKVDSKILDEFWLSVKRELVNNGIIPEIIIVNASDFIKQKHLTGYIYYWAEKEGMILS